MSELDGYLEDNANRFQEAMFELLRIPSVSADPAYAADMGRAADWLAGKFQSLGLITERIATSTHPILYAESPPVEGAPVVLVYGHYDVQPADPLNEWITPPFEPTVRHGNVYARGATDDKGQFLTHLLSVEAWQATRGPLPVQVKFLIEGEEECGSEALNELLEGKYTILGQPPLEALRADVAVISDTGQFGPGRPAITYGLKGIAYFQVNLTGPNQDLHSGSFGGAVTNPANAIARLLARLIDDEGRVQIPGFYDDVQELTEQEREQFQGLAFDEEGFKQQIGVQEVTGEIGYSTLERKWARPTFDINGLWSGYQGEGAKTVLPARAGAKFSFRLVPGQKPEKIAAALELFLREHCPPGIEMEFLEMHHAPGVVVPLDSPYLSAASQAIEAGFGTPPVYIREGGSIPIVTSFKELLGIDTLLLGWGQNDDNMHSPNEKFSLDDFQRGIRSSAHLWEELGQLGR
jgi:acetylornithine deacetylase/succinyl-diaminopimelate desuccinylase-like protein